MAIPPTPTLTLTLNPKYTKTHEHTKLKTCAGASTEAIDVTTGALPDVQLAEWEVDNYTRPEYTLTPTVEHLNSWVRVAGSNEFDLADDGYGACLRYEAAVLCARGAGYYSCCACAQWRCCALSSPWFCWCLLLLLTPLVVTVCRLSEN